MNYCKPLTYLTKDFSAFTQSVSDTPEFTNRKKLYTSLPSTKIVFILLLNRLLKRLLYLQLMENGEVGVTGQTVLRHVDQANVNVSDFVITLPLIMVGQNVLEMTKI